MPWLPSHMPSAASIAASVTSPEHTLVLRWADNSQPMSHATIGTILNQPT
jgi:hypothetical protein